MALPQPDTPYLSNDQVLIAESKLAKLHLGLTAAEMRQALTSLYTSLAITPLQEYTDTNVPILVKLEQDTQVQEYTFYARAMARYATQDLNVVRPLYLADAFWLVAQIKQKLAHDYPDKPELLALVRTDNVINVALAADGYYQEDKLYSYRQILREEIAVLIRQMDASLINELAQAATTAASGAGVGATAVTSAGGSNMGLGRSSAGSDADSEGGGDTQSELAAEEPLAEDALISNQRLEAARLTSSLLLANRRQFEELFGIAYENADQAPPELRQLLASRIGDLISPEDWTQLEANPTYRVSLLGKLRQRLMSDATFWTQAAGVVVHYRQIQPGQDQHLFTQPLQEVQSQLKIEAQELGHIQSRVDAFIVTGTSPAILAQLSPQEFQALFNLTHPVSTEAMAQVTGLIQTYWILRSAELRAVTGSSLVSIPDLDQDPLMTRFAGRVSRDKLYEFYSARHPISRQEFDALVASAYGSNDKVTAIKSALAVGRLGHSATDVIYALDPAAAAVAPATDHDAIREIKRLLAIDAFHRLSKEQRESMQWVTVEGIPDDSLDLMFAMNDLEQPAGPSLGAAAFMGAADTQFAQAQQRAQEDPRRAQTRGQLDAMAAAAGAIGGPWGKAAQAAWGVAPEFLKNFAADLYARKDKILPVIGLGLAGAGAALLYLASRFPLAFLGAGAGALLGSIFGPAGAALGTGLGFGAGMFAHNAIDSVNGWLNGVGNTLNSAASSAANGVGNFFNSVVDGAKSSLEGASITKIVIGGTGGTMVLGTLMTSMTASTFLQPVNLAGTPDDISRYVSLEKTPDPKKAANPTTVNYTITLQAKDQYRIKITGAEDVMRVTHKDKEGPTTAPGITPPDAIATLVGQEIGPDAPVTISYSVPFGAEYNDAAISNTFRITFDVVNGEETIADQKAAITSRVCFGDCPSAECIEILDSGSVARGSIPWPADQRALVEQTLDNLLAYPQFFELACAGGNPIKMFKVSGGLAGWGIFYHRSNYDEIYFNDGPFVSSGGQDARDYIFAHELTHVIDFRNSRMASRFAEDAPWSGSMFTYPLEIDDEDKLQEAFAEAAALYVTQGRYPAYNLQSRHPNEYNWIETNIYGVGSP